MSSAIREGGKGPLQEEQVSKRGEHSQEIPDIINDPLKGLDQTLSLLAAKDDTSRFVGLALLKSALDHKTEFQKDPKIIEKYWEAIPPRFLDRLLKAGSNVQKPKDEAASMVKLAVAILHAFIVLLPDYLKNNEKSIGRIPGLLDALAWRYVYSGSDEIGSSNEAVPQIPYCRSYKYYLLFQALRMALSNYSSHKVGFN